MFPSSCFALNRQYFRSLHFDRRLQLLLEFSGGGRIFRGADRVIVQFSVDRAFVRVDIRLQFEYLRVLRAERGGQLRQLDLLGGQLDASEPLIIGDDITPLLTRN